MAKSSSSQIGSGGKLRKSDLVKILRDIETIKDGEASGPIAAKARSKAKERARNGELRSEVGELLLNKVDIRKAEALIARHNKESAMLCREETIAARKRFLSSGKSPRARIPSPLENATSAQLTEIGNRSFTVHLLPIATVARPSGMLWDTQALGSTGLAKIYFAADQSGPQPTLEFWYTWVNASTEEVRVNVSCPVLFNGECRTQADIGLFFGGESGIQIDVLLDIYEWWKNGHPKALNSGNTFDTRKMVLNERTEAGGVWAENAEEIYPVNQYERLRYGSLAVPPGGRLMTRVKVQFYYDISGSGGFLGGGYVSFDFASKPTYAILPSMMLEVTQLIPPLDPNP